MNILAFIVRAIGVIVFLCGMVFMFPAFAFLAWAEAMEDGF